MIGKRAYLYVKRRFIRCKCSYLCVGGGKWVDLKTLPPEQQEEIKKKLTDKVADALAVEQAKKCS